MWTPSTTVRTFSAGSPITFTGVPGAGGELPVIDGQDATTRLALDYWGENRSVVKVGGFRSEMEPVPVETSELQDTERAHVGAVRDFVNAIQDRRPPLSPCTDNFNRNKSLG